MKSVRLFHVVASALLCLGGASCESLKNNNNTAQYPPDGGYNPYGGQPGQVATQPYASNPPQYATQPQYQTYTPSPDYTPAQDYAPSPNYTPSPDYAEPPPAKPSTKKRSSGGAGSYTVRQGDTLYRIALNHGTTVSRLKSANGLTSDLIHPGQNLTLP